MAREAGRFEGVSASAGLSQMAGTHRQAQGGRAIAPQLRKTKLCSYYLGGNCRLGSACAFAHEEEELRAAPDLRKTRLCRVYVTTGQCADRFCGFAHGHAELRATGQFYKRTLCKFHQRGKCRNNDQCRFAHGAGDLRMEAPKPAPTVGEDRAETELHEPMKVQLRPPRRPDAESPMSVLSAALADQAVARLAMLGAGGRGDAQQLLENMRRLQGRISELSFHVARAQAPAASGAAPPGLGGEDTSELAACILRSKFTQAAHAGGMGPTSAHWTTLIAA